MWLTQKYPTEWDTRLLRNSAFSNQKKRHLSNHYDCLNNLMKMFWNWIIYGCTIFFNLLKKYWVVHSKWVNFMMYKLYCDKVNFTIVNTNANVNIHYMCVYTYMYTYYLLGTQAQCLHSVQWHHSHRVIISSSSSYLGHFAFDCVTLKFIWDCWNYSFCLKRCYWKELYTHFLLLFVLFSSAVEISHCNFNFYFLFFLFLIEK